MATAKQIAFHYDQSSEFFSLLLGPSMTYSCANWESASTLEDAQNLKHQKLLSFAQFEAGKSLVDLGCGWGGMLQHVQNHHVYKQLTGITLSREQARYCHEHYSNNLTTILEQNIFHLTPTQVFDCAISIGAFEHIASSKDYQSGQYEQKYDHFFRLANTIARDGFGLQTIVCNETTLSSQINKMRAFSFIRFMTKNIFPGSLIPRWSMIEPIAARYFHIEHLEIKNDNYIRTLDAWRQNLDQNQQLVDANSYRLFSEYLLRAREQFENKNLVLAQIALTPRSK